MHPIIAEELAHARRADEVRRRVDVERRHHAVRRRRGRPPGPSRARVRLARALAAAATRLAPEEARRRLGAV